MTIEAIDHHLMCREREHRLRDQHTALRAEVATIKAQAEDATEYVLAVENAALRAEVERLQARVEELHKAIDTLLGWNDRSQYYYEDAVVELEAARQKEKK